MVIGFVLWDYLYHSANSFIDCLIKVHDDNANGTQNAWLLFPQHCASNYGCFLPKGFSNMCTKWFMPSSTCPLTLSITATYIPSFTTFVNTSPANELATVDYLYLCFSGKLLVSNPLHKNEHMRLDNFTDRAEE